MAPSTRRSRPSDGGPPPAGRGASRRWDALYGGLLALGGPYLLWRRYVKGKDRDPRARREKWGRVAQRAPHPRRVWIHAVSVGETRAAQPLLQCLRREVPDCELVVSTTTATGQELARQLYGADSVFFYPYDFSRAVKRSFDRTGPRLITLLELEVWPNLTAEAAARGVPVVVVNGRITERAARGYRRGWALVGPAFQRVRRWLMQSEEYAERLRKLGVAPERIEVAGNLKYDLVQTARVESAQRAQARRDLAMPGEAQVVLAGSTHPTEETALLEAREALQSRFPRLRLVLVPRHPERLAAVEEEIRARGCECLRRSTIAAQPSASPAAGKVSRPTVVLVDTMGELSRLYAAADVAFVGGSLIPHGGQNLMEPAGMGLATAYGRHVHNFAEAARILAECRGGAQVSDRAALAEALGGLLADPEAACAMGERARLAFLRCQGAARRCVAYLKTLLAE